MRAPPHVTLPAMDGKEAPALACGRMHELCGPARRSLALLLGGAACGPVIWIVPAWSAERLHAPGLSAYLAPGRLTLVECQRPEDILWSAEEALRDLAAAAAAGVVVADLSDPPGLTPVRRLHLAAGGRAERPGAGSPGLPLGLLLTPAEGGAAGVESRWHLAPLQPAAVPEDFDTARWRLERRRARGAGPAAWRVEASPHAAPRLTRLAPGA